MRVAVQEAVAAPTEYRNKAGEPVISVGGVASSHHPEAVARRQQPEAQSTVRRRHACPDASHRLTAEVCVCSTLFGRCPFVSHTLFGTHSLAHTRRDTAGSSPPQRPATSSLLLHTRNSWIAENLPCPRRRSKCVFTFLRRTKNQTASACWMRPHAPPVWCPQQQTLWICRSWAAPNIPALGSDKSTRVNHHRRSATKHESACKTRAHSCAQPAARR